MRMAARLGAAARQARLEADFRMIDVAVEAGVSESTVHYFERGTAWRKDTDAIVAAYAKFAGLRSEDLWRRAVDLPDPPAHAG